MLIQIFLKLVLLLLYLFTTNDKYTCMRIISTIGITYKKVLNSNWSAGMKDKKRIEIPLGSSPR